MGMAAPIVYTADMVRALPDDGNRYEVVDGELLVTPSPTRTHQHAVSALLLALGPYLRAPGRTARCCDGLTGLGLRDR